MPGNQDKVCAIPGFTSSGEREDAERGQTAQRDTAAGGQSDHRGGAARSCGEAGRWAPRPAPLRALLPWLARAFPHSARWAVLGTGGFCLKFPPPAPLQPCLPASSCHGCLRTQWEDRARPAPPGASPTPALPQGAPRISTLRLSRHPRISAAFLLCSRPSDVHHNPRLQQILDRKLRPRVAQESAQGHTARGGGGADLSPDSEQDGS